MRIVAASLEPPPGLGELLDDLGSGENGFGGTPVHSGEASLEHYLRRCVDSADVSKLRPGYVPQTVYWALDTNGRVVGMVKLRHYLNDGLRIHGGHVGYYVHSDHRGQGYGSRILALALDELRQLGETRALITTDPDNAASIGVIETNGGRLEDVVTDPTTGGESCRYWVDLA